MGRTIGHGEPCTPEYPCWQCRRIAELEAELATIKRQAEDATEYVLAGMLREARAEANTNLVAFSDARMELLNLRTEIKRLDAQWESAAVWFENEGWKDMKLAGDQMRDYLKLRVEAGRKGDA